MKLSKKITVLIMAAMMSSMTLSKEKVVFWHAMSGELQTALNKVVDSYNNSQDAVEIEAIFQGTYEEILPKFKSVQGTSEAPAMIQMNEIMTEYMYKSKAITPIQNFVKKDNFDITKFEDALINYYTIEGTLYSMPFNSSAAVLMYNKDLFKEMKLEVPKSYKEVAEVAKKLTKPNGERTGFALIMNSWFPEQLLANLNHNFINENNGRTGKKSTAVAYDDGSLKKIFQWLDEMYKDGSATSYGRNYDATRTAFSNGKVAMYLDSSAGIRGIINTSNFEVETAFIPNETGEFNGVIIGGASLWITNSTSEIKQNSAWDFIKYAVSKNVQAQWAIDTGYYTVNKEAYDLPILQETLKKYPQMQIATNELKATKKSYATSGAVFGVFSEVRDAMALALEEVYEGEKKIDDIIKNNVTESNKIIQRYNRINK
ncbi:MAG: ABC transporter substrate-binding protein [Fusobacteriaceae bacterium]